MGSGLLTGQGDGEEGGRLLRQWLEKIVNLGTPALHRCRDRPVFKKLTIKVTSFVGDETGIRSERRCLV